MRAHRLVFFLEWDELCLCGQRGAFDRLMGGGVPHLVERFMLDILGKPKY